MQQCPAGKQSPLPCNDLLAPKHNATTITSHGPAVVLASVSGGVGGTAKGASGVNRPRTRLQSCGTTISHTQQWRNVAMTALYRRMTGFARTRFWAWGGTSFVTADALLPPTIACKQPSPTATTAHCGVASGVVHSGTVRRATESPPLAATPCSMACNAA